MTQVLALANAIDQFITGCKADGTWGAIKSSCVLAGWNNLDGALTPLVGTAPTNNNFVSGDYNRETGLLGDGSTKYLDSNRNNNADPQNSRHGSIYVSTAPTAAGFTTYISRGVGNTAGGTILQIGDPSIPGSSTNHLISKVSGSTSTLAGTGSQAITLGLKGFSRNTSASHTLRSGNSNFTISNTSSAPVSGNVVIYAAATPEVIAYVNARLAFYSIGESLDLALLDTRVTRLLNEIKAALDSDAAAYIAAVEAVDGQSLEAGVKTAINSFVVGCKADGIWTAIKASCILAGARTLSGALVPLVGTAPTNFNFVSGDYNRKTGLVGDGSTKYLDSNAAHNIGPQNNAHCSVYASTLRPVGLNFYIGAASGSVTNIGGDTSSPRDTWIIHDTGSGVPRFTDAGLGFKAVARSGSANYVRRTNGASTTVTDAASVTPPSTGTYTVFGRSGAYLVSARLAFYSIGESLDLALLDARVTTLINAIAAAIP